jgi:hypothetical protein
LHFSWSFSLRGCLFSLSMLGVDQINDGDLRCAARSGKRHAPQKPKYRSAH